jgi:copper homeostasis protein
MKMSLVEIIVLNEEDGRTAEAFGADRLELVSAIGEGGLTPSFGTIKKVVQSVEIPVMVMVRPQSYSFVYRKEEWDSINEDIKIICELGAEGIVFGALTDKQTVDFELLAMVVEEAKGLSVTFHRAVDESDPLAIYQSLCQSGFHVDRILTSGGKPMALAGIETLKSMVKESQETLNRPIIMPGSALTMNNIGHIHNIIQATEYNIGSDVRIDGSFRNRIDGNGIQRNKDALQ